MRPRRPLLPLLAVLVLFAAFAGAQNTVGEISGYVRDPSGAVLPGASMTVVFGEIAVSRRVTTDGQGFYLIANLPNGQASLIAELSGFQKAQRSGVHVELNAKLRLGFVLGLGALTQTVEVLRAQTPAVHEGRRRGRGGHRGHRRLEEPHGTGSRVADGAAEADRGRTRRAIDARLHSGPTRRPLVSAPVGGSAVERVLPEVSGPVGGNLESAVPARG